MGSRFALRLLHSRDDVRVRAATAKVPAHPFADVGVRLRVTFRDARNRGTDLSGCAVTALKSIVLQKRRLDRMQLIAVRETFDRCDLIALMHDGETETGINPAAVDEHRARSALTVIAAFFRTGELQMFAKR